LYDWVDAQAWARNKGGVLIDKARSNWQPPSEAQVKARKAKDTRTFVQHEDWREYVVDGVGNRDVVTGFVAPVVMSEGAVNQRINDWWKGQPFMMGNNPSRLRVWLVGGVVHYNPTEWAKRGGRDVLVGLLAGWYPEQRLVLMDELAVA